MSSIDDWSKTAANNASSDNGINWAEGQAPSTVNNSARQVMGRIAEWRDDLGGTLTAGGTANAITVTANSAFTTYATGRRLRFQAASTNTAATTLSVNSIGAKAIRKYRMNLSGDQALTGGELQSNAIYEVIYDADANSAAGAWILQNPTGFGQTLDGIGLSRDSNDVAVILTRNTTGASGAAFSTDSGKAWIGSTTSTPFEIRVNAVVKYQAGASTSLFSGEHSFGALYSATGANGGWTHRSADGVALTSREGTSSLAHMIFHNPNGAVGSISTSGSATVYATSSDARRKKNKRDFDSGAIIDALDTWLFDWIAGGTGYGVIAQEAELVFPDAVAQDSDGNYMVDYSKFVPLLLKEAKMLRRRVAELESKARNNEV